LADAVPNVLKVDGLVTGYGKKQVVDGVTVDVAPGEIVALIGHNGAGKSTLLRAIFGLLPVWRGAVHLDGSKLESPSPRKLLRLGVAYVPQGNRVFADLSVRENLEIGVVTLGNRRQSRERIKDMLSLFPKLGPRLRQRAGTLSGGEKQMLALATGLITSPRLVLLDEPSLGLAPALVAQALGHIREISQNAQVTVLIVEQKVREVLKIARRVYVLRNGQVSFSGLAESLRDEVKLCEVYL
jgi:branched-chain amino acid transport system ATP-binding protein